MKQDVSRVECLCTSNDFNMYLYNYTLKITKCALSFFKHVFLPKNTLNMHKQTNVFHLLTVVH